MKKLIIYLLLLSNLSFGADLNLKYYPKGSITDFDGYLITPDLEQKFRLMDTELVYQKELNLRLESFNTSFKNTEVVMQERIDNRDKQIDNLTEKLSHDDGILGTVGVFMLGAAASILITFGVSRVTR